MTRIGRLNNYLRQYGLGLLNDRTVTLSSGVPVRRLDDKGDFRIAAKSLSFPHGLSKIQIQEREVRLAEMIAGLTEVHLQVSSPA